jgi:hypothetical protein
MARQPDSAVRNFPDLAAYVLGDAAELFDHDELCALLWHYTPYPFGTFWSAYRDLTIAVYGDRW